MCRCKEAHQSRDNLNQGRAWLLLRQMKIPMQCASLIGTLLLAVETKPLNRSLIPVSKKHTMLPVVFAAARLNVCVSGLHKNLYPMRDQPPIRACIRRRNSSQSINFAVPASISARRRRISFSQASNAPASSGASRLLQSMRQLGTFCFRQHERFGTKLVQAFSFHECSVEIQPIPIISNLLLANQKLRQIVPPFSSHSRQSGVNARPQAVS